MPDGLDLSQRFLSSAALIDEIAAAKGPSARATLLRRLDAAHGQARAVLPKLRPEFDAYYEKTNEGPAGWEEIVHAAKECHAAVGQLQPDLDKLEDKLAGPSSANDPEVREATQVTLDLGFAYLTLIRDLRDRLLKLAAERRAAAGEILHARPLAGEVDYAELSRETIAKFPKILAALAK
jgi:hypothetical protein